MFNLGADQQANGLPIVVPPRVESNANFNGRLQDGTAATLDQAIHRDESKILAQGRITITARFLNVNGLIQSGVTDIEFDVAANFTPPELVSNFTDESGDLLPGISFGTDGVPIDGYWDPSRQAFVLEDIEPEGGQITIAGQLLSTGNGRLKVASGLTGVDIDNQSPYDLILGTIDTTKDRIGKITVIDSGLLTKTEYEVVAGQIRQTDFTGTLNTGGTPAVIYTQVGAATNYNFGDSIQYAVPAGLHYVWTEGQDKIQLDKRVYEKKTFNLFGDFLADELAGDNNWKHREIIELDDEPLLESETRELENTTSAGEELVPVYANGSAYSIRYEQRRDTSVELFTNVSQVRHPPEPTGQVYQYIGANNPADLVLATINYGDTNNWRNLSALEQTDPAYVNPVTFTQDVGNNRYDSSYVNSEKTIDGPKCTGGGWLRTKTCTTKIDITTGIKDFYTHTLKADYPIDILFDQGPATPLTSIRSGGDILFEANMRTPLVGTVTIESVNGDVTNVPGTVLFGPSPTVTAGGEVLLTVEGNRGPINVSAQGDVDLEAISLDNLTSSLDVGTIDSAEGDVYIIAANGIDSHSFASIVRGEVIELRATAGEIGNFDFALPIDTSRSDGSIPPVGGEFPDPGQNGIARGGLIAIARDDVRVQEVLGNLVLTESERGSTAASVFSESGDVGITVTTGSLLDGVDELFRPSSVLNTNDVASDTLQFLQQGANQGLWNFESVNFTVSPGLLTFLYPHADTLGTSPPSFAVEFDNIVGNRVTLSTPNEGSDVGELQDITTINDPTNANGLTVFQKDVLSVANASDVVGVQYELYEFVAPNETNVDLLNEDYSDTMRWQPIAINHRTGTTSATRTVSTNQTVLVQFDLDFFGLYRYLGSSAELDLFAQNYNDSTLWQRLSPDHASDSGTPSLTTGQLVADKHEVDSLSLRLSNRVMVDARNALVVTANDRVTIAAPTAMLIERIEAGGATKLSAAASLIDLGIGDAAVATPASLEMRAGSQIAGNSASAPMRTQIGNAGLLRADAVAGIHVVQVAPDTTINGSSLTINDLFVSRAESAMTINITVDEGDLIVGRVLSSSDVILTAQSDIFDAFNDTGAEVVNVTTDNPVAPPSGDVTLIAGGQIGTAANFLDVSLLVGSLTTMSGLDQFVHSVRDIDVENMTSTGGSVSLRSEGLADVGVINALAGNVLVEARNEILDRDFDAASDINAINIALSSSDSRIGELLNDLEIDTAVAGTLSAIARLDVNVTEVDDSLTLDSVASAAQGHVRLTVLETAALGEDLILPLGGLISVMDGALWLQVGDNITLAGPVTAPRSYITGDYQDSDAAGSNITISGTFTGGNTIFLETADGNDVLALGGVMVPTHIRTRGGDDDVTGGQNNDDIDGGSGVDILRGGPGNDTLIAGSGIGDQLFGGDDNDLLVGSDDGAETDPNFADAVRFGDVIHGDAGDDRIYALGGADMILGGLGNDWIEAGAGSDSTSGGGGNDTIYAGAGLAEFVDGGAGNDEIWGSNTGDDTLHGGSGIDDIRGQDGNDLIDGGEGPDFIDGGAGADDLRGGDGDDEILGGGGVGDQLRGEGGDDVLRGSNDGADLILGGAGRDRAFGGGGNDTIEGGPGNDILRGEAGDDTISGDAGADVILGGADHDVLYALNVGAVGADGSVDYVYGDFGTNNDEFGSGGDQLFGDNGIDLLFGEGGDDLIDDDAQVAGIPTPGTVADTIDYGSGETADPTQFVPPSGTPAPPLDPPPPGLVLGQSTLPVGADDLGRWGELAGSATGRGLSGDLAPSVAPSIASTSAETFVAWTDARSGSQQVYVSAHDATGWTELGLSAGLGGVSNTVGASTKPSITVNATGAPVVAWTESEPGGTNIYVAQWDSVGGNWVALGNSLTAGGISTSGAASSPIVVETSFGTVVAWKEIVAGEVQAYARVFVGGAWQELAGSGSGGGVSNAPSGAEVDHLTVTHDTGKIAFGWTALDATTGVRQVYVREYTGTAWAGIAGSDTGTGVSGSLVGSVPGVVTSNGEPTLAYFGSSLWVGWVGSSDRATVLAVAEYDGSASQPILQQTISDVGRMVTPKLSTSASEMSLTWGHQPLRDQPLAVYSRRFDGANFAEFIPGDAVGQGITPGSITTVESISVTAEPTAVAFVDYVEGSPEIKVRRNLELSGTIHNASASGMTAQQILDAETLTVGDAIVINGVINGNITVSAADAGVSIIGAPGSQIVGDVTINGDDVVLQRLSVTGNVTTTANRTALRESTINGSVLINGGTDSQVSHNTIQALAGQTALMLVGDATNPTVRSNTMSGGSVGLAIGDSAMALTGSVANATLNNNQLSGSTTGLVIDVAGSGQILNNQIGGTTTGLLIGDVWTGVIESNDIANANIGVQYDAAAELIGNRIHDNTTGVVATVNSLTEGLGYVGSKISNEIANNTTGLELTGRARGQRIVGNTIGVVGSGVLGGEDDTFPNVIELNTTGVANFSGTIQFNRLEGNQTGIAATNDQTIFRNVFVHNDVVGVDSNGSADVRVFANTMHALTGDNVRVVGGSSEVEVRNNILWVESGYDIFVDNASQSGFFSDYNALFSSGTGRLVHWVVAADGTVLDFTDILDWQEDVNVHDLNSIGTTVVDPAWAKPQFTGLARGNYNVDPVAAGLRFTSPTQNAADPLSVLDWDRVTTNRLGNTSFESGLSSWTTNLAATTLGATPAPYSGASYFYGGADATSFAEQTIDLIAEGFTAAELDGRDLTVAFGGRIRSADGDAGQIVLTFLDGGNLEISSRTALASNVGDRWELVGDRIAIPQNTRSIRYRFEGTRLVGTTNNSYLDDAFVYVLGEDAAVAQGADGDQNLARVLERPELALRSPDLYVDFHRDLPGLIEWDSFGNTDDLPVRIDLLQDTSNGPVFHTNIVAVTDDDGRYSWTPADDLIGYGTFGWRIQVSLVGDEVSFDRSTETFSVPENTNTFYVNDGSLVGDQYVTAIGNNRSTGKTPASPKPYPNNVLRIYSLGANQTLFQDAGTYYAFSPTVVSNIVGVGDDEGFVWTGPDLPAFGSADNLPAHPATDAPVVLLDDSDQTTLRFLTLRDSRYGVHARAGSTAFTGEALTVTGHSRDGIYIQDNAEFTSLDGVVSRNNAQHGIHLDSAIDTITGSLIENNAGDGINAIDQMDLTISDSTILGNARGIFVSNVFNVGQTLIEDNEIAGSSGDGLDVSFGTTVRLNAIHGNALIGVDAARDVAIDQNVIFDNNVGVSAGNFSQGDVTITGNRLYDNATIGIDAWRNTLARQNTIYSTPVGIRTNSSSGGSTGDLDRNLIYDTAQHAILLRSGANVDVSGNTIYTTQGSGLRMEQNTFGTTLRNNIFVAQDSTALSFDTNSQTGIDSDFNLFHVLGTGNVALWQATPRPTLTSWRNAAFTDAQSLEQDPLLVDPDGADGVQGFVDTVNDGRDDDFHVRSNVGRFTGSLAPVFDAATGRTTTLAVSEVVDAIQSPAIDRGDLIFGFANEPLPNGGFINQGAYGNSVLASKSPTQFVLVIAPDGGEVWLQNQAFDVIWRSDILGAATTVDITLLKDGDAGFSRLIGDDVPNTGEFSWLIPADVAADTDYRIEVTRNDQPTLSDTSGETFTISEPISNYYVSATGDDANSGLSPAEPKASVAGILQAYDLEPGDTVIVGPGTYNVDSNILLQEDDSGVLIQGAVDVDGTPLTILDRGNTASGNYVFQLAGGDDIVLESLAIVGGHRGIYGSTTSDSDRIIVRGSQISGNSREQLWIRTTNDDFTIENSEVIGVTSYTGVRLETDNAVVRGNRISRSSNGVLLTGFASLAEDNFLFANSTGLWVDRANDTGTIVQNNRAHMNSRGIYVTSTNALTTTLVIGNKAFANTSLGIYASQDVLVSGNTAWQNTGIGIQLASQSIAENNVAYANGVGISAGSFSLSATARDNTVYGNDIGLRGYQSSVIERNTAFDNRIGIATVQSSNARVQILNNLIYDSQDYSIDVAAGRSGTLIRNNTLYEPTASGVHLHQSSFGIRLRNNVIEVQNGYAYDVDANSQSGFGSDYNRIYAPGSGQLALWDTQEFDSRADWVYELGFDFNSQYGKTPSDAPDFVDPDGPDDTLGYDGATIGVEAIVDDGDAGFSLTSGTPGPSSGFNGDSTHLGSGDAALWQFTGLTPGSTYEVAVTFPNGNYTSAAEYAFIDSGGVELRQTISQFFRGLGTTNPLWLPLTDLTIVGDTLTVELVDGAGLTVADAVRIREIMGDASADDNFRLVPSSAAIDAGSLSDDFASEPEHNARRINLGYNGGTDDATASADDVVQVLSPRGLEKITVGDTIKIDLHAAGNWVSPKEDVSYHATVASTSPIAHWTLGDTGGTTAVDRVGGFDGTLVDAPEQGQLGVFGPDRDTAMAFDASSGYVSIADDPALNPSVFSVSGWVYPETGISTFDAVISKTTNTGLTDGFGLYYYSGRIQFFVDQWNATNDAQAPLPLNEWTHVAATFDGDTARLYINGDFVDERTGITIDPTSAPLEIGRGRSNSYVWRGDLDEIAFYNSVLDPTDIGRLANIAPNVTVDLDLIDASTGAVVASIADDAQVRGSYDWTVPTSVTPDAQYRVRVTSSADASITDQSYEPFLIVNDGTDYYVNDSSTVGDVYTTSLGDNAGSGKSPASPMASLPALLDAYDLGPGDRIFVDGGTYTISKDLVIGAEDSGVTIIGTQPTPAVPNPTPTILDRANTSTNTRVVALSNADNVTLDSIELTNAYNAVYASSTSDSDNLTLRNIRVNGIVNHGVFLNDSNDNATIENSTFDHTARTSSVALVRIQGSTSHISGNQFTNGYRGVDLHTRGGHTVENNTFSNFANTALAQNQGHADPVTFRGNRFVNVATGIFTAQFTSNVPSSLVENNVVRNFVSFGIDAFGLVEIRNNETDLSSGTSGIGIRGRIGVLIEDNVTSNGNYGIVAGAFSNSATVRGNRSFGNAIAGIRTYQASVVESNRVYANGVGIQYESSSGGNRTVSRGNVVYDNTEAGFRLNQTRSGALLVNNTISQPVGRGIELLADSGFTKIRNNVIEVGGGEAIFAGASSEYVVDSDYNVIYTPGPATLGLWDDDPFDDPAEWYYRLGFDQHSLIGEGPANDPLFVDPDGPNNVRGFSRTPIGAAMVIDDGDAGFATTLTWTPESTDGFGGDYLRGRRSGSDIPLATWTFTELQDGGTYEVAATWPTGAFSTITDFVVSDSEGQLASVRESQFNTTPDDFVDVVGWENLGVFNIVGDTLTVTLAADDVNRDAIADAIRLQQVVGDSGADDDFHVELASPAVDAGEFISDSQQYVSEPAPNGGRINAGAFGGTSQATVSASSTLQILSPGNYQKIRHGETVEITWHAAGTAVVQDAAAQSLSEHLALTPNAYWRLNETLGSTVADSSGSGFIGNVIGTPDLNANGIFTLPSQSAMRLTQDNSYIEVPHDDTLNAPEFSVEAWINPASNISTFDSLISKTTSASWNDGFGIYHLNGRLQFFVDQYSASLNPGFTLPTETWTHVVGTFDGNTARLYANGELVGEQVVGTAYDPSTAPLEIGRARTPTYTWKGAIDEVAMYSRALTPAEIETAANISPLTNVDIELVDVDTGIVTPVISNLSARGQYDWTVPTSIPASLEYRLRISSNDASGVTATHRESIQVVPGGNSFYVNDGQTTDDVYTTAIGINRNDGQSPASPMSDLRALIQAYDLGPGDTVYVDTGDYELLRNVFLDESDSGVTIMGPTGAQAATLSRDNATNFSRAFEFVGADDVTLDSLSITGAQVGVYAGTNIDSDRMTLSNLEVFDHALDQVFIETTNDQATIVDSRIYDANTNAEGIEIRSNNNTILRNEIFGHRYGIYQNVGGGNLFADNEVYDNGQYGIYSVLNVSLLPQQRIIGNHTYGNPTGIYAQTSVSERLLVSGNQVENNANYGVRATGNIDIVSNQVFDNPGTGIYQQSGATVSNGNIVHGNDIGIRAGVSGNSGDVFNNRVFNNATYGIWAFRASDVIGNYVYSNSVGIYADGSTSFRYIGDIFNNLIYVNTNQGILVDAAAGGFEVVGNTILQPVGDAIRFEGSSRDARVRNNAIQFDSGYGVFVETGSTTNMLFERNLYLQGADPNAFVGQWAGTDADLIADWQAASGSGFFSLEADPDFIDIDGADNVIGYDPLANSGNGYDGGLDDNFIVRKNSPTIDRGNGIFATTTDIQGSPRLDDPDSTNVGTPQLSAEADLGSSLFNSSAGVAQNWRSFGARWNYALPFTFNYAGVDYNDVWVSSSGFLQFGSSTNAGDTTNSAAELNNYPRIAPMWDRIATNGTNEDIFVDTSVADQVTIRWAGRHVDHGGKVNFAVTLFGSGAIEFHYGDENINLTPTIGLSGYEDRHFDVLFASIDGASTLTNQNSLRFEPSPGYVDIGAYEFRGESSDVIPPQVTMSSPPAVENQGITTLGIDSIGVIFSEEVNNIDASAPAAYDLRASGPNGLFGDGDDVVYTVLPDFTLGDDFVALDIAEGTLPPGDYRLRIPSGLSRSIHDTAGLRLDGDADGTEGGDFERLFTVAVNQQPVADGQSVQTLEDTELPITLTGDDGDTAIAQNLTYWLTSLPTNGTIATSPGGTALDAADLPIAVPAQLYFTPERDSNVPEGFDFYVQDDGSTANGGVDTSAAARITISIQPVNDPPADVTLSGNLVTENTDTSSGNLLVGTLSAIDVDLGDSHTFEFAAGSGDTDNGSFLIVGDSLFLRQDESIDYEQLPSYSVRVAAVDVVGERVERPLSIDVLNLPEIASLRYDQNDAGNSQRSVFASLTVIFDQLVNVSEASFDFIKLGIANPVDAVVDFTLSTADVGGVTEATLQFSGQHMNPFGSSLGNGNYQLTVDGSLVTDLLGTTLDGDQDGVAGGDSIFGESPLDLLYRLLGDGDGDRDVDGQDYGRFAQTFLLTSDDPNFNPVYDSDGDGDIDGQDYGRFSENLFGEFPFP